MTRRDRTTGLPRKRERERQETPRRFAWNEGYTRWIILGSAALLLAFVLGLVAYRWYDDAFLMPRSTVLEVNDQSFTLEYFTDRLPGFAQQNPNTVQGVRESELLTKLSEEALTIEIARERGYDLSDEAVTEYIAEDIGAPSGGTGSTFDELYRQQLRETGLGSDDYRQLSRAALAESLVLEEITEGIREIGETVRPRVIVLETEEQASSIMEQLSDGENFGTLAQTESLDQTSAAEDGYMEATPMELLPEELRDVLAGLDEGERIDEPFEYQNVWWIVEMGEINPEGTLTDEHREQLAERQLTELIEERQADADIQRSLDDDDIQWAYDNLEVPAGLGSGQQQQTTN